MTLGHGCNGWGYRCKRVALCWLLCWQGGRCRGSLLPNRSVTSRSTVSLLLSGDHAVRTSLLHVQRKSQRACCRCLLLLLLLVVLLLVMMVVVTWCLVALCTMLLHSGY